MNSMNYDWKDALWTVVICGFIVIFISFLIYSPAFIITLMGGAEGHWSADAHWSRLSNNLIKYYLPIGVASGVCLMVARLYFHPTHRISVLSVLVSGVTAAFVHTVFVISAKPKPWLNLLLYDFGQAFVTFISWTVPSMVLSVLICAIVWLMRDFVGLRNL